LEAELTPYWNQLHNKDYYDNKDIINAEKWYNVRCLHANKISVFCHGLENFDLKKYLIPYVWK